MNAAQARPPENAMPYLGYGLGLRVEHYQELLEQPQGVDWLEIISENYMGTAAGSGGRPSRILDQIRRDYPIVQHGVSMSIGSTDIPNRASGSITFSCNRSSSLASLAFASLSMRWQASRWTTAKPAPLRLRPSPSAGLGWIAAIRRGFLGN